MGLAAIDPDLRGREVDDLGHVRVHKRERAGIGAGCALGEGRRRGIGRKLVARDRVLGDAVEDLLATGVEDRHLEGVGVSVAVLGGRRGLERKRRSVRGDGQSLREVVKLGTDAVGVGCVVPSLGHGERAHDGRVRDRYRAARARDAVGVARGIAVHGRLDCRVVNRLGAAVDERVLGKAREAGRPAVVGRERRGSHIDAVRVERDRHIGRTEGLIALPGLLDRHADGLGHVRVRDREAAELVAGHDRGRIARELLFCHGVEDSLAVLARGQAGEGCRGAIACAERRGLAGGCGLAVSARALVPDALVEGDGRRGARAVDVVAVVPDLGHGDRGRAGRERVGGGQFLRAGGAIELDGLRRAIGRGISGHGLLEDHVGNLLTGRVVDGKARPRGLGPAAVAVGLDGLGLNARAHVGAVHELVEVEGHACRADALGVVVVSPSLGHGESVGLDARVRDVHAIHCRRVALGHAGLGDTIAVLVAVRVDGVDHGIDEVVARGGVALRRVLGHEREAGVAGLGSPDNHELAAQVVGGKARPAALGCGLALERDAKRVGAGRGVHVLGILAADPRLGADNRREEGFVGEDRDEVALGAAVVDHARGHFAAAVVLCVDRDRMGLGRVLDAILHPVGSARRSIAHLGRACGLGLLDHVGEDALGNVVGRIELEIGELDRDRVEGRVVLVHGDVGRSRLGGRGRIGHGTRGVNRHREAAARVARVVRREGRLAAELALERRDREAKLVLGRPAASDELLHGVDRGRALEVAREVGNPDMVNAVDGVFGLGHDGIGAILRLGILIERRVARDLGRAVAGIEVARRDLKHAVVEPLVVEVDRVVVGQVARQILEGHGKLRALGLLRDDLCGLGAGKPARAVCVRPVLAVERPLEDEDDVGRGRVGPDLGHGEVALRLVDEGHGIGRRALRVGLHALACAVAVLINLHTGVDRAVALVDDGDLDILDARIKLEVGRARSRLLDGVDEAAILHAGRDAGRAIAVEGVLDGIPRDVMGVGRAVRADGHRQVLEREDEGRDVLEVLRRGRAGRRERARDEVFADVAFGLADNHMRVAQRRDREVEGLAGLEVAAHDVLVDVDALRAHGVVAVGVDGRELRARRDIAQHGLVVGHLDHKLIRAVLADLHVHGVRVRVVGDALVGVGVALVDAHRGEGARIQGLKRGPVVVAHGAVAIGVGDDVVLAVGLAAIEVGVVALDARGQLVIGELGEHLGRVGRRRVVGVLVRDDLGHGVEEVALHVAVGRVVDEVVERVGDGAEAREALEVAVLVNDLHARLGVRRGHGGAVDDSGGRLAAHVVGRHRQVGVVVIDVIEGAIRRIGALAERLEREGEVVACQPLAAKELLHGRDVGRVGGREPVLDHKAAVLGDERLFLALGHELPDAAVDQLIRRLIGLGARGLADLVDVVAAGQLAVVVALDERHVGEDIGLGRAGRGVDVGHLEDVRGNGLPLAEVGRRARVLRIVHGIAIELD